LESITVVDANFQGNPFGDGFEELYNSYEFEERSGTYTKINTKKAVSWVKGKKTISF
jgi:hypothetical protein